MGLNRYDPGEEVRLAAEFTDRDGALIDPALVTLKIRKMPGGSTTTVTYAAAEIVRESLGNFYYDFTCPEFGDWFHEFQTDGNVKIVEKGAFVVRRSPFA